MFGQAKGAFRKSLITLAKHHKIKVAWARIFMTFGPNEDSRRLVPTTILNLLRNEPVLASSGEQVRDLLHVDDVARGLVTLLDSNIEGDVNIASGEPRTLSEILTTLGAVTGKPELIKLGTKPKQSHEPPRIVANISRLRDELKFTPAVSFEERLLETVNWWREKYFLKRER
jgi:nucleoside-diphosphate-sugar epimerase